MTHGSDRRAELEELPVAILLQRSHVKADQEVRPDQATLPHGLG